MLTEKTQPKPIPSAASEAVAEPESTPGAVAVAPRDLDSLVCYFEGGFVPMRDAKVSIMNHAFMYGTAVFEGIRAYWNAEQEQLFGLFVREHMERISRSCRILLMEPIPPVDELVGLVLETVRRNGYREDVYVRPQVYKKDRAIGVRLHHLEHDLSIIAVPFGNYIDTESGVRVMTSTWRRNADEALPPRGKIVGGYVNMAFQKSEAELNGFDEAIVLTPSGHASEASAANLFMVRGGTIITPPVYDDILEGITRRAIVRLATDLGIPTEVRTIDRSELYIADEVFLCGTGVQVSPVVDVDHRPVGSGTVGPIARAVAGRYFDAVRGRLPEYRDWLTPIASA
ncbi:MAG TPA: branched-chain amino acid transaminase [Candidatus Limnocylindrales bacterium]|nr:branched-chain amino acid transaminase [Candidatus Limnocylindrales bacterium]